MLTQFNQFRKEEVITTNTTGAVTKAGIVFDLTHNKKRKVEAYTLIKVVSFNFSTKKVVIDCMNGLEMFTAEVNIDFLLTHCAIHTPDKNREINAVLIQHVAHNLLDKDTAIFIVVMILTYLCGLILGKVV
jgi:hypothetical protein